MSVTLEVDLKETLDKIDQKLDRFEGQFNQRMDRLEDQFNQRIDKLDEQFNQRIDKLDEQFNQRMDKLDEQFNQRMDKLDQRFDKLEDKTDKIEDKVDHLSVDMATVKTKLEGLDKRLENQEFVSRGVLIGLVIAILGGFAKLFGLVGSS